MESARENILVIKTTVKRQAQLEREIQRMHSYDIPECIALPVGAGSAKYLSWLEESVRERKK